MMERAATRALRVRKLDSGHAALFALRRRELERWIDHAIAILDDIDGDPDSEDDEREPDETDQNGDEADKDRFGP